MKIIFLDIDGVLNVLSRERDEYGALFHEPFVENLRRIIEYTGAKIVISSSWRMSGLSIMMEMWQKRNLPGEVVGITPREYGRFRGVEIQKWMNDKEITQYCIIDDDTDMLPQQKDHFVRTSCNMRHSDHIEGCGLTRKCADMAIKILNER